MINYLGNESFLHNFTAIRYFCLYSYVKAELSHLEYFFLVELCIYLCSQKLLLLRGMFIRKDCFK